ncbi:MAG: hypothetical protein ABIH71_06175, partial [Candidatus Omnitrophota bacterium]
IFVCLSGACKKLKLKQANRLRKYGNTLCFVANVTKLAINTTLIKKEPKKSTYFHQDVGCAVCLAQNCKQSFLCLKKVYPEEIAKKTLRYIKKI